MKAPRWALAGAMLALFVFREARSDPFARAALCFSDFARGHFFRNLSAAKLSFLMARDCGEVEPLVRCDKVAGDAVATRRKNDAEIEVSSAVASSGSG